MRTAPKMSAAFQDRPVMTASVTPHGGADAPRLKKLPHFPPYVNRNAPYRAEFPVEKGCIWGKIWYSNEMYTRRDFHGKEL